MAQRKDVSIQFLARECGVSIATVSRVINNDKRVSAKTKARVLDAMRQYGYEIPAAPTPSVRKVGIIIATETSDYYMALVLKLHDFLKRAGYHVLMSSYDHDLDALPGVLESMYDCGLSGLVLITSPYQALRFRLDNRLPHVWIDCNDPHELTEDICQVQSDQSYSGQLAAQELYRKGCVNPIMLCGPRLSHRSRERMAAFFEEYRRFGISLGEDRLFQTPMTREILSESHQMIRYLVTKGVQFDGVFAVSDWRALGTYLALTEQGIKVPEEVKIIGYDGVSIASRTVLNITSVQQNIELIAQNAADLLLKQINHEEIKEKRVIIPTHILPGQTL